MDASDKTKQRKGRTLFADRIVQQTIFDKGRRNWIVLEGGVHTGRGAMTFDPHYYNMQEGAVATSEAEFNALIAGVPNKFPNPPTNVVAALVSGQVIVSFSAPAYTGTTPITSYTVISNPGGIRVTGASSPITMTGLTLGQSYTFTVTATNSGGSSTPSAPSNSVATATVPDAPTNLGVIPTVGGSLIYFTVPNDGGSPITDYEYSTDDGVNWNLAGTTSSPVTVDGLAPGTPYSIKLRAVNAIDPGAESVAVTATGLTTFSPADIADLNVWLDSHLIANVDVSGGKVTAWNDRSSVDNDFTASGTGVITYDLPSEINGRPALNFTTGAPTTSTYLTKNVNLAPTNQLTVFLVVRHIADGSGNSELFFTRNNFRYLDIFSNTQSAGDFLSCNVGSDTQRSTGVTIVNTPPTNALISFVVDSTIYMYVNGNTTDISGAARGVGSFQSLNAALDWALSGGAFLGNFGELICYSSPLSTGDRQSVEGYLAWKWGMQSDLPAGHPYRDGPPAGAPSGNLYTSPSVTSGVTTVAQSPFSGGGDSYSFNGTTNFLNVVTDDSWDFGTGDFTIEWFQYQTDNNPFTRIFALGATSFGAPPGNVPSMQCSIESGIFYTWFSSPGTPIGSLTLPFKNTWQHFAIVRRTGLLKVYRNGIQIGSSQSNTTNISNSSPLYFGAEIRLDGSSFQPPKTYFGGYLTNIRIVKGLAVYTGDFTTPTSALTETATANPYGGSNTVAIPAGFTKLLFVP